MNDNQLQQLLQAINTLQDLGKVAYFNKGAYNSETTYEINDVVTYQGSSYVSLGNNNQGNLPTNATYWSVVALKGDKGDTGKPFVIEKTYISIQEMVADYDNMNVNDYVMISGSIEDEQNATLWTKTETPAPTYKWVYLADFSGASGITGQTPNIQIGNVTEGNEPAVTRRQGSTNENPILDFVLKTGATGDTGATGNGISQVSKTSTSGLTDTYTIEYTSGNSTTFDVTNGKGITSIAKTDTSGLVDTYTITYNDETTSTFTITNGEDGEVTQAQLDETNNQVAKANMVYNALPKVSDEGDNLTLDGTANCPMKMELKGNTEQTTYTGKNLFDKSTIVAGDITNDAPNIRLSSRQNLYLSAGTYTISTNLSSPFRYAVYVQNVGVPPLTDYPTYILNSGWQTSSSYTFIINEGGYFALALSKENNAGLTVSEITNNNIQLEANSTVTSYEPYVGGSPSPSPDYPQDVRVVTGNNSVKVIGKNIAYIGWASDFVNRINNNAKAKLEVYDGKNCLAFYPSAGNDDYDNKYMFKPIGGFKENTQYTFKIDKYSTSEFGDMDIVYTDGSINEITGLTSNSWNSIVKTSTANKTIKYLKVRWGSSNWQYIDLDTFMVYEGTTPTTYEPYQSQTYPINLGTMELCKIPNTSYQDIIFHAINGDSFYDTLDNATKQTLTYGKWYKHSEIGKVVLDGSESDWVVYTTNVFRKTKISEIRSCLSNYYTFNNTEYIGQLSNGQFGIANSSNAYSLCFKNTSISSVADFKAWLSTHNTIVYYVLATPTNEEITDTTLISQLNAIENSVSYDTQTNIVQENYSEPFIINAECVRSLKDIFELIDNS